MRSPPQEATDRSAAVGCVMSGRSAHPPAGIPTAHSELGTSTLRSFPIVKVSISGSFTITPILFVFAEPMKRAHCHS